MILPAQQSCAVIKHDVLASVCIHIPVQIPMAKLSCSLQVIEAIDDGKPFDEEDAQLKLNKGTPRQDTWLMQIICFVLAWHAHF